MKPAIHGTSIRKPPERTYQDVLALCAQFGVPVESVHFGWNGVGNRIKLRDVDGSLFLHLGEWRACSGNHYPDIENKYRAQEWRERAATMRATAPRLEALALMLEQHFGDEDEG